MEIASVASPHHIIVPLAPTARRRAGRPWRAGRATGAGARIVQLVDERVEDAAEFGTAEHAPVLEQAPAGSVVIDLRTGVVIGGEDLILGGQTLRTPYVSLVKPAFDRLVALTLILLALPLMIAVALVVRFSLGKGIIYRQERVGLGGRTFSMYKFRTMHPDRRSRADRRRDRRAEAGDRRVCHKRDDDPRHTPLGRRLRRWSLDELPQLFNVLKGDMSLVGPRPELRSVVDCYAGWQHLRHRVRPGLTGLWQVTDRSNGGLMRDFVHVDLEYVERVSLWTDLGILVRTPAAVLSARRAG